MAFAFLLLIFIECNSSTICFYLLKTPKNISEKYFQDAFIRFLYYFFF